MKYLIPILIVAVCGNCLGAQLPVAAKERSISSEICDALENMKVQMETGWPEHGIPPLAPLEVNHKQFNVDGGEFSAKGEVDNLMVQGLNEFEIIDLKVNAILSRMNFEFLFASLNVTTDYQADVGSGYRMERSGGAFLALENLRVTGQIKYSLGLVSGNVKLKEIKIYITVDNVVSNIENLSKYRILNRKMNEVIEEFITLTINDSTDYVAEWINTNVTPVINDIIGERSLKDILDILGGGSKIDTEQ